MFHIQSMQFVAVWTAAFFDECQAPHYKILTEKLFSFLANNFTSEASGLFFSIKTLQQILFPYLVCFVAKGSYLFCATNKGFKIEFCMVTYCSFVQCKWGKMKSKVHRALINFSFMEDNLQLGWSAQSRKLIEFMQGHLFVPDFLCL